MSGLTDNREYGGRRPGIEADEAWRIVLGMRRSQRSDDDCELSAIREAGGLRILAGRSPNALLCCGRGGEWDSAEPAERRAALLFDLYLPLSRAPPRHDRPYVVAHLGQSLDGRIATVTGSSQWVTGPADLIHTHRMRALADAVLVGAGTVRHDDPRLTVRRVEGDNPLRVVIDAERRLPDDRHLFRDGAAPTLLFCAEEAALWSGPRSGQAEVVALPRAGGGLSPAAVCAELARRGVRLLFVEGGGVTVSRFLRAGCVDRLQVTVAPVIIGSGRPAISLPEVDSLARALRPRVRHIALGDDVMFDCIIDA